MIAVKQLATAYDAMAVHHVYVPYGKNHTHVLFYFGVPNVYLVIVVDNVSASVHGYRVMNFVQIYGLTS